MISLREITKSYHHGFSATHVLRRVSLDVGEGEFVTITGPSGSGKSTLLHIMGLLDEPTQGEYHFLGEPAHRLSERRRAALHREHIGFVFQAYHLIDDLTVYENLETPLLYKKIKKADRQRLVAEVLDRFQIVAKKDLFPNQLSGGQQQLVGVARALIIRPRLILADEPTGNLHSSQGDQIMDVLKQLNEDEGVTVVQVTHNDRYAAYGHRIVELLDGRVEADRAIEGATA
ncbi:MAG: ABC transporter ATP-binding protein [Rhodothermales bacterium]|nr:ABC transporter ATP-binding protein [Rhodothermales bacterium]